VNNQYQIQITPGQQQYSNPSKCGYKNGLLNFGLYKWDDSTSTWDPDSSSWSDLQIEAGDEVTWVWLPSGLGYWPVNTSLAWLWLAQPDGAKICTDPNCTTWSSPQSLAGFVKVETGALNQKKSFPAASSCPNYTSSKSTYIIPGSGKESNTITVKGGLGLEQDYLRLTYTIWFKTNNYNYEPGSVVYWYYDPEITVRPSASGGPPTQS